MYMPSRCFFAIIFEGQTGSSYTVSALNRHPHILCYPEIFCKHGPIQQRSLMEALVRGHSVEDILLRPLKTYFIAENPNDKQDLQAVGLKTTLQDVLEVTRFFATLRRHRFKLIYLKRKNIVKSTVSYLNAMRLHRKHGRHNAYRPEQVQGAVYIPAHLFVKELKRRIQYEIWHEEFFRLYDLDKRTLYYEDLLRDWDAFWANLLDYLEVDWIPGQGRFFKNTPDRLVDAIQNYQEIRRLFAGTVFEPLFDE